MEALAYEQLLRLERDHWWFRGRRTVYLGLLRHLLGAARPRRALDVGAGVGGFVQGLAELCDSVVALEPDRSCLELCRGRAGAAVLQGASDTLPFAGASFDLVALFDVLEHLDDDRAALREARRVLRPGGLVFASVPAYPWLFADNDRVALHRRRYTRTSLARVFEGAGLEIVRNTHSNALLLPLIAPAVLLSKAWEHLRPSAPDERRTNLSWRLPPVLDEVCYRAFAAELPLARRCDLPAGHSIALAARRPG